MTLATHARELLSLVANKRNLDEYREQHWTGAFEDYLEIVAQNPAVARNAFQRCYDMILTYGQEEYERCKERMVHYRFFDDPLGGGRDALFGLDGPLMRLVNFLKSAARGYGTEKRVLLLHGPVGSSKSTVARIIKRVLEAYSRGDAGVLYSFGWVLPASEQIAPCPMHEDPLKLIPHEARPEVERALNAKVREGAGYPVRIVGDLCPACRMYLNDALERVGGDWHRALSEVRVHRLVLSEKDRRGIGTFQPKDEKNQDSTELTGDINYRKIAEFGTDSDPRAFNFDGEFNVANRGLIEFIEVLKLDVAFLYDLLGASQEHTIKPKKFAQTDIDEVILGHTNEPEYRKLQNNELMEAFRDRTFKIDIPYITVLEEETKIYRKDYNAERVRGKHIAPHTIEISSMWAILTRLVEPKKAQLSLLQKLKLYNGKSLPGFTEDNIRELRDEAPREGMGGISPRYVQDKISNALVSDVNETCVNPFMVMNELASGLDHHSLIVSGEQKQR